MANNLKMVRLRDIADLFLNSDSATPDTIIYTVNNKVPKGVGQLLHGVTTLYAGTVGNEFFMTRGHTHTKPTAEVYYGLFGTGIVYMTKDGEERIKEISPRTTVYVEPGWAHRVINNGDSALQFLCVCDAEAGHDYAVDFPKRFTKPSLSEQAVLPGQISLFAC